MSIEPNNLERDHWNLGSMLVVWAFILPRAENEPLRAALKRHTCEAFALLRQFAAVHRIEWITASHGDDAAELRPEGDVDVLALEPVFARLPDVIEVSGTLDLRCVSSEGVEFLIRQGGNLRVLIVEAHDGREERLQLELSIDADIYSPRTYGRIRENARLAAMNGPRLSGFLRAVRDEIGGTVSEIETDSYEELVTDEGFVAMLPPRS